MARNKAVGASKKRREIVLLLFFFRKNIIRQALRNLIDDVRRTIKAALEARLIKRKLLLAQRRSLQRRILIIRPTLAFVFCV